MIFSKNMKKNSMIEFFFLYLIDKSTNVLYCISVLVTLIQLGGPMFIIDIQSKIPIFEQLKKQILEFISIGILLPNDKLPSVRSLATDIGVNPNTVSKAYQELENQGYIYSVKGKGCFIADNQTDQLIKDDKLDDFKGCVNEMKKHQITKDKLLEIIEEVYKEETV